MVSNDEIMDMLKVILQKVECLENIKTDKVTISSGTITIQCGGGSEICIETAEDILIQASGKGTIDIESAEAVSVDAAEANSLHIECGGDIENGITVNSASVAEVSIDCGGDIQGDVLGYQKV